MRGWGLGTRLVHRGIFRVCEGEGEGCEGEGEGEGEAEIEGESLQLL